MFKNNFYDVIVIGAGHAGIEAALAASKIVSSVLLISNKFSDLGELACNPSIGGVGKGHLVKEIDALGGIMGILADNSGINFKLLNSSKGYAVQSTRVLVDRTLYKKNVLKFLNYTHNITFIQQTIVDLIIKKNKIKGVVTGNSINFFCKTCVLTVGTFLNGAIFIGELKTPGGRLGDKASIKLADKLKYFFPIGGRLKTGTPPRIKSSTINKFHLSVQKSDLPLPFFSFWHMPKKKINLRNCYVVYTNNITHEILIKNLHLSSIYNGNINVLGPRYCPSIEDKVIRFKHKISHQIFLEPEGLNSIELYPNGISTSMPIEVQIDFLKSIKSLKNAVITRPGYAVEYDFFDPRLLNKTLETKSIKNLFFAGQINGTTGYEEAAAQGFIAGVNAANMSLDNPSIGLNRNNSYIGLLIDDLVTKGIDEPYRMLTSRVENRIILREDNADYRLTNIARQLKLIDDLKWGKFLLKYESLNKIQFFLKKNILKKNMIYNKFNYLNNFSSFNTNLFDLFKNQLMNYKSFLFTLNINLNSKILKLIEIKSKYKGYLKKQNNEIKMFDKFKYLNFPININYFKIPGISLEVSEKLNLIRPKNLYDATKIPGISLSSLLTLLIYIKKK